MNIFEKIEGNEELKEEKSDFLHTGSQNRMAFLGLSRCAGTTTIAYAFANYLFEKVKSRRCKKLGQFPISYVELGKTSNNGSVFMSDRLGIETKINLHKAYSLICEGKSARNIKNIYRGINHIIRLPNEIVTGDVNEIIQSLAMQVSDPLCIFDVDGAYLHSESDDSRSSILNILKSMDSVFVVVDPLPYWIIASYDLLQVFRSLSIKNKNVFFVINKYNKGVSDRDIAYFFKKIIRIEMVESEHMYSTAFSDFNILKNRNVTKMLSTPFSEILEKSRIIF